MIKNNKCLLEKLRGKLPIIEGRNKKYRPKLMD